LRPSDTKREEVVEVVEVVVGSEGGLEAACKRVRVRSTEEEWAAKAAEMPLT
jgi:hypothetical protein